MGLITELFSVKTGCTISGIL